MEYLGFIEKIFRYTWIAIKWLFRGTAMVFNHYDKDPENTEQGRQPKTKISIGKTILICFIILFIINLGTQYIYQNSGYSFSLHFMSSIFNICFISYTILKIRKAIRQNKNINDNDLYITPKLISDIPYGVVFGKKENCYITKPETKDGHILVVGGVGSGKSSCIAIPTLRCWNETVFAIDIKGELYEKTKRNRPNIKVFNPQDENACGYDPYFFIKHSRNPAQEAHAIAQAIIPLPLDVKDPFWIESGQNILTGAILHYYTDFSFIDTLKQIQLNNPQDLIKIISQSDNEKARLYVNSFVGMGDNALSGIFAEVSRGIITLVTDDEIVSALTKKKVISPDDLEYGQDIYINIPEHLLRQWKNLLTLIVNQFLTFFEKRDEYNSTPILFLLDEFPRLGKISTVIDGLATLRSKKISICLIVQSLAQLDVIYGQNERKVISDTCSYKAILGATDADTQEYFSKLVGTYDKPMTAKSKQAYTGIGTNDTTSEQERRIIKPEEFGRLHDIVLLTPYGYFRVEKNPYYE